MTAKINSAAVLKNKIAGFVVALIGNPNAGKSTVFNALCGYRQKTANYPGATVELKSGDLKIQNHHLKVLDLPGLYSFQATSPDEKIALDVLLGHSPATNHKKPDLILNIVDVSNLKRNLFLYTQLSEMQIPVIMVLTMHDILEKNKQNINIKKLEKQTGIPIVIVHSGNRNEIQELRNKIVELLDHPVLPRQTIVLPGELEKAVNNTYSQFKNKAISRPDVLMSLMGIQTEINSIEFKKTIQKNIHEIRKKNIHPATLTIRRYKWIDSCLKKIDAVNLETKPDRFINKLDDFLTHRFFGMLAFITIMFLVFQSIYSWSGPVMDYIDFIFSWLGSQVAVYLESYPIIQSLVRDGVFAGIGSVVVFLPQILLLFLFISILEDSGYMARAAFLMDRLLGWAGLNGRAFIPMLSSFACAVPGVMAARVMPDERARLTTILVAPLMSCSARLPVYVLLIGALIEPEFGPIAAAGSLFIFHILGLLVALPVAFIMNKGVLKTPGIPFLLELPDYRMPELRNVSYRVFYAGFKFLKQAGTIIFAMTIIIWAMSYFPRPEVIKTQIESSYTSQLENEKSKPEKIRIEQEMQNQIASTYLEQSYLGRIGFLLQPVFAPLGFNWKITVGIISAFPAREVIIATLGIIYNVGDADEQSGSLRERMLADRNQDGSKVFTPLVAFSLMIFFALSSQCMSTLAVVYRELKSWKWTGFLFTYMTILAYISSLIVYQAGVILGLD